MENNMNEPSADTQRTKTYFVFAIMTLLGTFLYLGWILGQHDEPAATPKVTEEQRGQAFTPALLPDIPDVSTMAQVVTHPSDGEPDNTLMTSEPLPSVDSIFSSSEQSGLEENTVSGPSVSQPDSAPQDMAVVGASLETKDDVVIPRTYTVQKGDTLSHIAKLFFGDARKWRVILSANNLKSANTLRVGMVLTIPQQTGADTEATSSVAPQPVVTPQPSGEVPAAGTTYVIRRGDTLQGISQRFYRTPNLWQHIQQANPRQLPNEHILTIGTRLTIPPRP